MCVCVFFFSSIARPWSFVQTTKAGGLQNSSGQCKVQRNIPLHFAEHSHCCVLSRRTNYRLSVQPNQRPLTTDVCPIHWLDSVSTMIHTQCWFEARAVFDTLSAAGSQEGKSIWCDWTLGTWQKSTNRNVSQRWSHRDLRVTVTKSRVKKFFSWLESVIKGLVKLPPEADQNPWIRPDLHPTPVVSSVWADSHLMHDACSYGANTLRSAAVLYVPRTTWCPIRTFNAIQTYFLLFQTLSPRRRRHSWIRERPKPKLICHF